MSDLNCRYCGREVFWRDSKAGKRYLAEAVPIIDSESGRHIKTIFPAHNCSVDLAEKQLIDAQIKADHDAAIERGEIIKGQRVVIFKGRKYAVGTAGNIDWVAQHEDRFGVLQVRMILDSGERIYVNRANVRAELKVETKIVQRRD